MHINHTLLDMIFVATVGGIENINVMGKWSWLYNLTHSNVYVRAVKDKVP